MGSDSASRGSRSMVKVASSPPMRETAPRNSRWGGSVAVATLNFRLDDPPLIVRTIGPSSDRGCDVLRLAMGVACAGDCPCCTCHANPPTQPLHENRLPRPRNLLPRPVSRSVAQRRRLQGSMIVDAETRITSTLFATSVGSLWRCLACAVPRRW
jgi:hypothetical protein